uniref:Transposase IS701-like DDE domain-containing protein n=1 Tax=Streptomyces avermitilis TaxID=33903 RepID=A0A499VDY0_STRAX|nr:hypothetical protein SAVMC3_03800 [Streptomyces avermitilis]
MAVLPQEEGGPHSVPRICGTANVSKCLLSAAAGAKGHRFYDWALIDLAEPGPGRHQMLIRRNRTPGQHAYYRCFSPEPVPLAELVRVAGSRWRVEETFQSGKGAGRAR